jgi:small-conductance mechanosensitive channel
MDQILDAFADPIIHALPKIPQAILALMVGWLMIRLLHWMFSKVLRIARTPKTLFTIMTSIADVVLWVILIAVVFQSLGLNQVALALSGSVAIIGVAIGTGANSLVQDIITGLFLSRDPDFDVGFVIRTESVEGTIRRIDLRKVRIEDKDGKMHVLPNSNLDRSSWVVLSRNSK